MEMCKYNFFYRYEKKFSRIWLIILYAELPLGNLYIVQRFLSCLSASCPKRLQILFSVAFYFCKNLAVLASTWQLTGRKLRNLCVLCKLLSRYVNRRFQLSLVYQMYRSSCCKLSVTAPGCWFRYISGNDTFVNANIATVSARISLSNFAVTLQYFRRPLFILNQAYYVQHGSFTSLLVYQFTSSSSSSVYNLSQYSSLSLFYSFFYSMSVFTFVNVCD